MSVLGKLKGVKRYAENADDAARTFGRELSSNVKKDLATKGSAGQRFADAPLGQYYLPGNAQKALDFIAPSPRKFLRDTKNVVTKPSVGNTLAAANSIGSVATLPMLVPSVSVGAGARVGGAIANRLAKKAPAKITPIVSRMGRFDRIKAGLMSEIRGGTPALSGDFKRASESARGVLKELGGSDSMRKGSYNSIAGYLDAKGALGAASARAETVGRQLKGIDRMRTPLKALPKKGEAGWIRMTHGDESSIIRMGKGKFPGAAKLATEKFGEVDGPGAGFYKMVVGAGDKASEMNVDYMKRVGKDISLKDIGGELEAVRRSAAAQGIDSISYAPVSASRKRLFDGLLKAKGVEGKAKTHLMDMVGSAGRPTRPKVQAPRRGLLGKLNDERGSIDPDAWSRKMAKQGKMELEDLLDTDIDEAPIDNLSVMANRLGIGRSSYGNPPFTKLKGLIKGRIGERRAKLPKTPQSQTESIKSRVTKKLNDESGWIRITKPEPFDNYETPFQAYFGPGKTPKAFRRLSDDKLTSMLERMPTGKDFKGRPFYDVRGAVLHYPGSDPELYIGGLTSSGKLPGLANMKEAKALMTSLKARGVKKVAFSAMDSTRGMDTVRGRRGFARLKSFSHTIKKGGMKPAWDTVEELAELQTERRLALRRKLR